MKICLAWTTEAKLVQNGGSADLDNFVFCIYDAQSNDNTIHLFRFTPSIWSTLPRGPTLHKGKQNLGPSNFPLGSLWQLRFCNSATFHIKTGKKLRFNWESLGHTLFRTDSMRAGCLACQNKNPRTIRWKIVFSGFIITLCRTVSSGSVVPVFAFPNCPAEFNNATPTTCSGNPEAVTNAVNPPRLKITI